MAADPIWKKKLMEALGFTPRYDIDIQQHGKPRKDLLQYIPGASGASGLHPGVESGYMGGIFDNVALVEGAHGYVKNQNPTQVGFNKPSIMGGAGGGKWKKVLDHLGKMTGPEPDWSLSPQKMGVPSPWSPTNVQWSKISPVPPHIRKKKEGPY